MSHLPIPKISPATYDLAHQCCLQLWCGLEFSDGTKQASDAYLLETWASKFQKGFNTKKSVRYTDDDIRDLTYAARVGRFLKIPHIIKRRLNASFNSSIRALYTQPNAYSDDFSEELGRAIAKNIGQSGKIIVASRMLFFAIPDRCLFNLNEKVADKLQMPRTALRFKTVMVNEMHQRCKKDWGILKKYKMPHRTPEISKEIWQLACDNGWWQRRVLDVAILLHLKLASATYTKNTLRIKQKPKKC